MGAYDVDKLTRTGPIHAPSWTLKGRTKLLGQGATISPGPAYYDQAGHKKKQLGEYCYWPTMGEVKMLLEILTVLVLVVSSNM